MNDVVGLLDVSLASSSRGSLDSLPGRRFGDQSLLEWMLRRVSDCQQLQRVVVVASAADASLLASLTPPRLELFASNGMDPLSRLADAAVHCGADSLLRVRVDCPFVDSDLLDHLASTGRAHPEADYVSYMGKSCGMTLLRRLGLFGEFCRTEAIVRADRLATEAEDRNQPTRFIYSHPELFQLRFSPAPSAIDHEEFRLAIQSEDDWENAQVIYDALGPEELHWSRIADLLNGHPDLLQQMSVLNQQP